MSISNIIIYDWYKRKYIISRWNDIILELINGQESIDIV